MTRDPRYGYGRGRGEPVRPVVAADAPTVPKAAAQAEPPADGRSVAAAVPVQRALRVLPLGAGLLMVGLGIGFLGLRLRGR
ncbi:hypothetical protein [Streptomyces sp. NBC_01190]|uniref:hypothetical protein n=1 Tax=Streptomyces sp. NBC_01190 TaxID=2903767 RepID=UPI003864FB78|nr:hypothetical protein OG519_17125 [Streptomyces sp. NBC_01190]